MIFAPSLKNLNSASSIQSYRHRRARLEVLSSIQPGKESEMNITRIGLALAKHVFSGTPH
jgi:hypothetical protein